MAAYDLQRVLQTRRTFSNWPSALARVIGGRLTARPAEVSFRTRTGVRMTTPNVPGAILPLYEVFAEDCYRTLDFYTEATVRRVLDVGAHVGAFTIHLASVFRAARVDCFEPSPATSEYLQRNVDLNRLSDRVTVHQYALGAAPGTVQFVDNGHSSVHNHVVADGSTEEDMTTVPVTSFDAVVAEHGPYEVVKMDCERGEYPLVLSSSPESWSSTTHVVMEYHNSPDHSFEQLVDFFASAGLTLTEQKPDPDKGEGLAWFRRRM